MTLFFITHVIVLRFGVNIKKTVVFYIYCSFKRGFTFVLVVTELNRFCAGFGLQTDSQIW